MPTFLLRDGREHSVHQAPEGLDCLTYETQNGRTIHAIMTSASERRLLEHCRQLLPFRRRRDHGARRAA
jgi:hypothetical protein